MNYTANIVVHFTLTLLSLLAASMFPAWARAWQFFAFTNGFLCLSYMRSAILERNGKGGCNG